MKKIVGVLLILLLASCSSTSKKTSLQNQTGYTFDNFDISENRVGVISKGMTIADVYAIIPEEQIRKETGSGEFAGDTYDDYEVYDSDGKKLLVLTPIQNGNTNAKINRVSIVDDRFKTTSKIGLSSTFGDLAKSYSTDNIAPDEEHVVLTVEQINARFSISKTELRDGWWNGNEVDTSKIPGKAKLALITIWWD